MKAENNENLMNGKIKPEAEELADLPATDEQAHSAKGGPLNFSKIEFEYKPQKPDGSLG